MVTTTYHARYTLECPHGRETLQVIEAPGPKRWRNPAGNAELRLDRQRWSLVVDGTQSDTIDGHTLRIGDCSVDLTAPPKREVPRGGVIQHHGGGVGTEFARIIKERFGAVPPLPTVRGKGCSGCESRRLAMDKLGAAQCRKQRERLLDELMASRSDAAFTTMLPRIGLWLNRMTGIGDDHVRQVLGEALDEAIRFVEHRNATRRKRRSHHFAPPAPRQIGNPTPRLWTREPTRNLICHIFPVRDRWQLTARHLIAHADLWNGRVLVSVMTDRNDESRRGNRKLKLDPPAVVRQYLTNGGLQCDILAQPNDPKLGEFVSFPRLLAAIRSSDPDEVTLYVHSKGAKHHDQTIPALRGWIDAMAEPLLDWQSVSAAFERGHSCVGSIAADVFASGRETFAGSFFWFRHSDVVDWDAEPFARPAYTTELWPQQFAPEKTHALVGSVPKQSQPFKQLYTGAYWQGPGRIALASWRKSRPDPLPVTPSVTLVTPTGDRPEAFAMCEKWMRQQTWTAPVRWIVVDDGRQPTPVTAGQLYVRRVPRPGESARHTLTDNLRLAIPHITGDVVAIIEDDEYYGPEYLATAVAMLRGAEIVGEQFARYYYLRSRSWRVWHDHEHSSLCRTAFRRSVLPTFEQMLDGDQSVDLRLWSALRGKRSYQWPSVHTVGIKGVPGRKTHHATQNANPDPNLVQLQAWCPDWRQYLPWVGKGGAPADASDAPDAVYYTVNLNGYDIVHPIRSPRAPCVLITDEPHGVGGDWRMELVPHDKPAKLESRRLKILSHERFDAEWVLYADAQFELTTDVDQWLAWARSYGDADLYVHAHPKRSCVYQEAEAVIRMRKDSRSVVERQVDRYRRAGIKRGGGLYLGGLLIRRQPACREFEKRWWQEVVSGSHRDQLSLPLAIRESGVRHVVLPSFGWQKHFRQYHHGTGQEMTRWP